MRIFCFALSFLLLQGCIPVKIAPQIETDKIYFGKKLKKNLSRNHFLVFEDPKDANHFYDFINAKFKLNHTNVGQNTPITIDGISYYFSYREVEREDKTINLVPIVIDASRESKGKNPLLNELHTSRKGLWYIALEVFDEQLKDALHPNYPQRKKVADFLRNLRKEYLVTSNYTELLLKKKRP